MWGAEWGGDGLGVSNPAERWMSEPAWERRLSPHAWAIYTAILLYSGAGRLCLGQQL